MKMNKYLKEIMNYVIDQTATSLVADIHRTLEEENMFTQGLCTLNCPGSLLLFQ